MKKVVLLASSFALALSISAPSSAAVSCGTAKLQGTWNGTIHNREDGESETIICKLIINKRGIISSKSTCKSIKGGTTTPYQVTGRLKQTAACYTYGTFNVASDREKSKNIFKGYGSKRRTGFSGAIYNASGDDGSVPASFLRQ